MKRTSNFIVALLLLVILSGCKTNSNTDTYQQRKNYLNQFTSCVELASNDGQVRVLIAPEYQGRVAGSTANGMDGYCQGWLNMPVIEKGQTLEGKELHGEERVWIGPQGSQFSFFYGLEKPIKEENWDVPNSFNNEAYRLISASEKMAHMEKDVVITNNFGTTLHMALNRTIELYEKNEVEKLLNIYLPKGIATCSYETRHTLTNLDTTQWDKETGLACIWSLSTFKGTDQGVSFIPLNEGDKKSIKTYLSDTDDDRLLVKNQTAWYKTDGKFRNKLGIPHELSKGMFGNYQPETKTLRIIQFKQEADSMYFNTDVFEQEHPYRGEPIAIYNHGPMDLSIGSENAFFELESTSPLRELNPNESTDHYHRVFQFYGDEEALNQISEAVLGVKLTDSPFAN